MGTLKRSGLLGKILNIREMVFVQVQVESAGIVAVRVAEKCSGNVRSSFFLGIIFIFSVGLSGCESVHLNIDFI